MAAFALLASSAAGATPTSPAGRWLTEDKGGVIEIAPCGDALCGRIIGMDYKGAMPTDHWHRPQCGLGLLYALKPGDTSWNGSVLDPQTGKMYSAKVSIPEPGVLKLRGYVGIALFGQTVTWTRYPGGPIGPACHLPRG
jgi:uncharacterized protein (DUF2147 family)